MRFTSGIPADLFRWTALAACLGLGACDDSGDPPAAPVGAGNMDDGAGGGDASAGEPGDSPSSEASCQGNDDCELECEGDACTPVCGGTSTCLTTCPAGKDCAATCWETGSCGMDCGEGKSCTNRVSGSADLNLECASAEACAADCSGSAHCQIDAGTIAGREFLCTGSAECFVECPAGGCDVTCEMGAKCELACTGDDCKCTGEGCALECDGEAPVSCLTADGAEPVSVCDASQC